MRRAISIQLSMLALTLIWGGTANSQTADPEYAFPLIKGHGGVVKLNDAAEQPQRNSKVVLDVISGKEKKGVIEPLEKAARIANLYAQAGVGPKDGMKLTLVLHGDATKAALSDAGYKKHVGQDKNPNRKLIEALTQAGADVYVCGQALAHHNYALEEVAEPVTVADSAASVNINRQLEGYAYLPFH